MVAHDDRPDVSTGWFARFGLLYLGQNIAWAAPVQILIAVQILAWYPDTKEDRLALVMLIGGAASLIASPLAGVLSDRTRTRFGRRAPWILAGALASAACLLWAGASTTYLSLVAAWAVFQVALAVSITAAQSVPPDRVPGHQYGTASGVMGITYTLGVVLGVAVGTALSGLWAWGAVAGLLVACVVPFLLVDTEPPPPVVDGPRAHVALPRPGQHADFYWVFVTRLLVTMAQSLSLFYLLYYLRDRIGVPNPELGVLILTLTYAVFVIAAAGWSGRSSDRSGRRKMYVATSSYGVAAACVLMAAAGSFTPVVAAAALLGASWGVYQAIDQALINHVLPSPEDRATHMGLLNIAVAGPNTAAPVVAALALKHLGGYPGLYLLAAVLTVAGGILVWRVRGVK